MKPTKEQIGKLLVWCGFEYRFVDTWLYPDGSYGSIPDIDSLEFLGFLFKYAMELVRVKIGDVKFAILMRRWVRQLFLGEDPVLALFWVLDKIREENDVSKVS